MFKLLEPVVLKNDVPAHGLSKGLLGTVVEVYSPAKVEVEFVAANGRTVALLPLSVRDLRKATDSDALAVTRAVRRKADVVGPFASGKLPKATVPAKRVAARIGRRRRSRPATSRRRRTA